MLVTFPEYNFTATNSLSLWLWKNTCQVIIIDVTLSASKDSYWYVPSED